MYRTGRLLAPQVEMVLELFCNKPEFFLFGTKTSGTGVRHQVTLNKDDIKVTFHLRHLNLHSSVYNDLKLKIDVRSKWATYPIVRGEIRDNVFLYCVPDRLVVGLLDSKAFNGDLEYYPYAFQDFGVTSIHQIISGEEYPYSTLELNGTDTRKDFLEYHRLLEASGLVLHHRPHMIHPEDWGFGSHCTLFTFNNVPNGDASSPNH